MGQRNTAALMAVAAVMVASAEHATAARGRRGGSAGAGAGEQAVSCGAHTESRRRWDHSQARGCRSGCMWLGAAHQRVDRPPPAQSPDNLGPTTPEPLLKTSHGPPPP